MQHNNLIDKIIRVNHAGEYGAKRIYQGQIAYTKNPATKKLLKEMLEHEAEHLQYFEQQIKERKVRPTALFPLWHALGYGLGAVTAMLGEKTAMACTYAVEEVIEGHYQNQLDKLDKSEAALKKNIKKFQAEEVHHRDIATEHSAEEAFGFSIFKNLVAKTSKTAIWLSERF